MHGTPAIIRAAYTYFAGCDEVFPPIPVSDGKDLGDLPVGAYTGTSVAVANGRAYFGTFENEVLAVDLAAKKVVWRYQPKERQFPEFYSLAAIAGGKVILGGRDKVVRAMEHRPSGKAVWTFATEAQVESSAAVAGSRVYIGSNNGQLLRARPRHRQVGVGVQESGSPMTASPAIAGGVVCVIGTSDGTIICFGA